MKKSITSAQLEQAEKLLLGFVEGQSKQRETIKAEAISVFFDETFPDDPGAFDDLVTAGAMYNPEGGELLFDEADFEKLCRTGLRRIARIRSGEVEEYELVDGSR